MHRFLLVLLAASVGCTSNNTVEPEAPTPPAPVPREVPVGQLPEGVTPKAYRIDLTIVPERDRFSGTVEIDIELAASTDRFFLHGKDLDVTSAQVGELSGRFKTVTDTGGAELSFPSALPKGPATLRMEYTAPFNRALQGIYKVVDAEGNRVNVDQAYLSSARSMKPEFC